MKRGYRLLAAVLLAAALLCLAALAGCAGGGEKKEAIGTVAISITCHRAAERRDELRPEAQSEDIVPPDGVILAETQAAIVEGDTVYSVLTAVTKNKVQLDVSVAPGYGSAYVKGIHNLYELDGGALSGWTYSVNGEFPQIACNKYRLKSGDVIEWQYTLDLGKDLTA